MLRRLRITLLYIHATHCVPFSCPPNAYTNPANRNIRVPDCTISCQWPYSSWVPHKDRCMMYHCVSVPQWIYRKQWHPKPRIFKSWWKKTWRPRMTEAKITSPPRVGQISWSPYCLLSPRRGMLYHLSHPNDLDVWLHVHPALCPAMPAAPQKEQL